MKHALACLLLVAWLLGSSQVAAGDINVQTRPTYDGAIVGVSGGSNGDRSPNHHRGGGGPSPYAGCVVRDVGNFEEWQSGGGIFGPPVPVVYSGREGIRLCIVAGTLMPVISAVSPRAAAEQAAEEALSKLVLDLPAVATSPPQGGIMLVGVPVWFWVTNTAVQTTTASITGLSATLTAVPAELQVTVDGSPAVTCPAPGVAYDPTRPGAAQTSPCSHIFQNRGDHTVDITVRWDLTWEATNGQRGTLPAVDRAIPVTLHIQEARPVTD